MCLKSKENTAQEAFLGKGSFRRPTTGSLYGWEKRKHSCPGVPNDINERTLYLAKKGKSRLKNNEWIWEFAVCFYCYPVKSINKRRRFLYLMSYSLQFGKSESKPCFSTEFSLWSWKSPLISPWKIFHQFSKEFQLFTGSILRIKMWKFLRCSNTKIIKSYSSL